MGDIEMNIEIDREKNIVYWNNGLQKVCVNISQILFAYEYEKDLVMIKSKNGIYKFYLFDISGNKLLSYKDGKEGLLNIMDTFKMQVNNLITVEYSPKYKITVLLCGDEMCDRKIILISNSGEVLAEISCPNHYYFSSLKTLEGEIIAVCVGDETTIDTYKRNDWNFKVHLDNYYLEKLSITQ